MTPCSMFLRPLDQCLQALRGTLMHDPMHGGPLAVSVLASTLGTKRNVSPSAVFGSYDGTGLACQPKEKKNSGLPHQQTD